LPIRRSFIWRLNFAIVKGAHRASSLWLKPLGLLQFPHTAFDKVLDCFLSERSG
jgi:hypothetical protein